MIDRLWDGKAPAPSWNHCTRSDSPENNGFTVHKENVAFVPPDKLIKSRYGCENLDEAEIYREPAGCVLSTTFSQIYQHGEPFGTGYYDLGNGVIVDEREHCDIAEADRHPSCFNMMPDDVDQEELLSKSPQRIFENMCPLAPPEAWPFRSWCWDHSADHCSLDENDNSRYCRRYEQILAMRASDN